MIDMHLDLPFEGVVLGVAVIVKKVDVTTAGEIVAPCNRGGERQAVPILELPLPDPPPPGCIERALTDRQMQELRAISTRAAITRTSFSNYYTFGDLKADPRDLLVKYFDASLNFANWLYLEIAFRYPKDTVAVKALRRYASGHSLDIRTTARDLVAASLGPVRHESAERP